MSKRVRLLWIWVAPAFAAFALLIVSCSSGPPELAKVIKPEQQQTYGDYLQVYQQNGRDAYLHWRSEETDQSVEALARKDQSLSQSTNPFSIKDEWAVQRGAITYQAHCISCHGPSANGIATDGSKLLGSKDFHNSHVRMIASMSDGYVAKWFKKIYEGSDSGKLAEDGEPRVMPAMKDKITNEQIWLSITYLMSSNDMKAEVKP